VAGGWIKLYNDEFHVLYCLPETVKMSLLRSCDRWGMCDVREL
jgi:hypothetical protein